eukprot:15448064-Alexandrium_andersonii.AAC.1
MTQRCANRRIESKRRTRMRRLSTYAPKHSYMTPLRKTDASIAMDTVMNSKERKRARLGSQHDGNEHTSVAASRHATTNARASDRTTTNSVQYNSACMQ